jgi:hypothetical protein
VPRFGDRTLAIAKPLIRWCKEAAIKEPKRYLDKVNRFRFASTARLRGVGSFFTCPSAQVRECGPSFEIFRSAPKFGARVRSAVFLHPQSQTRQMTCFSHCGSWIFFRAPSFAEFLGVSRWLTRFDPEDRKSRRLSVEVKQFAYSSRLLTGIPDLESVPIGRLPSPMVAATLDERI